MGENRKERREKERGLENQANLSLARKPSGLGQRSQETVIGYAEECARYIEKEPVVEVAKTAGSQKAT